MLNSALASKHHPAGSAAQPYRLRNARMALNVRICDSFDEVINLWKKLLEDGARASPYQRPHWLSLWWRHVGKLSGASPMIVYVTDERGEPLLLLPLVSMKLGPLRVGSFMGGKHANFNLPVWTRKATAQGSFLLECLVDRLTEESGLDLLLLQNQPGGWAGEVNPLLLLPHQPSPASAYSGRLLPDFNALLASRMSSASRKKLRKKERELSAFGPVSFRRAETASEVSDILDVFLAQKSERMKALGLANAFDGQGVSEFVRAAAAPRHDRLDPGIAVYALRAGSRIVASFGGIAAGDRFSGMFNSMAMGDVECCSPGELLLAHVVRDCCERGFRIFDLGIGEASYKRVFCDQVEPLFDTVMPLSLQGKLAAPVIRNSLRLKASIKKSDAAMRALRAVMQCF